MGPSRANPRTVPLLVVIAALTACAGELPGPEDITYTRVLALRVEVEEEPPAGEGQRSEALPLETVSITPWIVDPDGPLDTAAIEALEPIWLACNALPRADLGTCLGVTRPLDASDIPDCVAPTIPAAAAFPPATDADEPPFGDELPESPSPCRLTAGTPARPELTVPLVPSFLFGGDIEITMVASADSDTSSGDCLADYLEKADSLADACMFSTQRVAIGPDGQLLALAEMLGFDITDLGPIPDEIPEPDRNPTITSFRSGVNEDDGGSVRYTEVPFGSTLVLEAGQTLDMLTEVDPDDLQTYLVPQDNGETFTDREETVYGMWFKTWGRLLANDSQEVESYNAWRAIADDDSDVPEFVNIYYVLRDSRHGVDWWWFRVELD